MKRRVFLLILFPVVTCLTTKAVDVDSLNIQAQIALYGSYNPKNEVEVYAGGLIIPQLDYFHDFSGERRLSFEISGRFNGSLGVYPFDAVEDLSPDFSAGFYRVWVRYSTQRNELRAGLQQINFGSASILRPLQWFDGLDPTDPLHLTNGVWGLLDRIYFKNNSTLWLWGLYGNTDKRVWDLYQGKRFIPEFGFRFQQPVPMGEIALSMNRRSVDLTPYMNEVVKETKIGLDGKWDLGPGLWFEDSFTSFSKLNPFHQGWNLLTVGADFTSDALGDISFTAEQLISSKYDWDQGANETMLFSAASASWPISMFSRLSGIALYSWSGALWFRYLTWSTDFNKSSIHLIGFWNSTLSTTLLPFGESNFFGYGAQLMVSVHL
jgi:hypothetical protein